MRIVNKQANVIHSKETKLLMETDPETAYIIGIYRQMLTWNKETARYFSSKDGFIQIAILPIKIKPNPLIIQDKKQDKAFCALEKQVP